MSGFRELGELDGARGRGGLQSADLKDGGLFWGVINSIYYVETVERIKRVNKFSAVPCPT